MNKSNKTSLHSEAYMADYRQIMDCIHSLEAKVKELDTDVSKLVENESEENLHHYEFTTIYDFIDGPKEGDVH